MMSKQTAMERARQVANSSKTAIAAREQTALATVEASFNSPKILNQLERCTPPALRGSISPDMLLANAMMEIKANAYLAKCTPISVIGCIIRGARLGLVMDGVLGHCYMIPRTVSIKDGERWRKELQANFQLGYKGIAHLVYRGDGIVFRCRVVSEGDDWNYQEGLDVVLEHKRKLDRDKPPAFDEFIAAYSVATFPDGRRDFRVFGRADIIKARNYSDDWNRRGDKSVWSEHPEAMTEKALLIKHSKQLPLSGNTVSEIVRGERSDIGKVVQSYAVGDEGIVERDVDDSGNVMVDATIESSQRPPCEHPLAAREDDGTCGACGEKVEKV